MRNEELTQLLAPVIADLGLECVGVEYSPSHGNSLVRVYIEAADRPVTVDDCEVVSRQVSASLDVHDPIEGRYTLEVSSPGLDRPLYTPEQFARFIGESAKLEVNLPIDGRALSGSDPRRGRRDDPDGTGWCRGQDCPRQHPQGQAGAGLR